MNNVETIIRFLTYLGLGFEESKIYLALIDAGNMTVLELSRYTKISRTNVYRIVERMKELGIAEEMILQNKKLIKPVGIHKLELLVKEQEARVEYLKDILPELASIFPGKESITQPGTKVLFYKGAEGIKQMVWNTLRASKEVVGYSYREIDEIVGKEFALRWRSEFVSRSLKFRDIIGDTYQQSVKKNKQDDNAEKYNIRYFESRCLSENILEINHQIDIYNDIVSYYNWYEGDVFGVEIYNTKVAKLQKQLFEIVWRIGEEV